MAEKIIICNKCKSHMVMVDSITKYSVSQRDSYPLYTYVLYKCSYCVDEKYWEKI